MNGAVSDLKKNAQALFETVRLTYDSLETYATPRRLVLDVKGLADLQEDLSEEVKGPSVKAAYKDGQIAKPLEGFLRANGFTEADVYTKEMKNGEYVFCKREEKGRPAKEILAEVMPGLILDMKFPKSMRWGSSICAICVRSAGSFPSLTPRSYHLPSACSKLAAPPADTAPSATKP